MRARSGPARRLAADPRHPFAHPRPRAARPTPTSLRSRWQRDQERWGVSITCLLVSVTDNVAEAPGAIVGVPFPEQQLALPPLGLEQSLNECGNSPAFFTLKVVTPVRHSRLRELETKVGFAYGHAHTVAEICAPAESTKKRTTPETAVNAENIRIGDMGTSNRRGPQQHPGGARRRRDGMRLAPPVLVRPFTPRGR